MPLVPMTHLLAAARRDGYAVCYCEAWNLESFQAVVEAAEELRAPTISGFNGGFLRHAGRSRPESLAYYAGFSLALCRTDVPVAFLLNETDSLAQIQEGIDLGFNAVMVENEHLRLDKYRQLVKQVVKIAHKQNVSVEAQVGLLPAGWAATKCEGEITDPVLARTFVEATGIDALGISIGNVHVLTQGKARMDLEALRRVSAEVRVPLVLHGGSGIPSEAAREVIALGVAKVNFGTLLKQAYLAAIRDKLAKYREPMSPHPFLGMGGHEDILVAGREAVKRKVKELLRTFGSAGKLGVSRGARGHSKSKRSGN
jgi:ketose-bisphosphate aldolase